MNCRVLLMNGLNAAGNQVASFMNSLGAFSASSQLPFFTLTFSLCFVPRETVHLPLPYLPFDLIPFYLNTILLCELVLVVLMAIIVLLKCSQCSEFNLNPTLLLTHTHENRKNDKTKKHIKTHSDVTRHYIKTLPDLITLLVCLLMSELMY